MPNKDKETGAAQVPPSVKTPLPMPKYEYQSTQTASLVIRYEEQKECKEEAGQEKPPQLQNLRFF
jgi:hypothetical protein